MAVIVITWDESPDKVDTKVVKNKAFEWRNTVLKQPGLKQFQVLRKFSSPHGMVVENFASSSEAMKYLESEDFSRIVGEMGTLGMTNINATLWSTVPDVPTPLTSH